MRPFIQLGTLIFFSVVLLRLASTPTANLSFVLLAVYATTGRAQAIQALAMSWLLTMISPGIAPDATLGSIGRYAVFFGAFLSVFVRSGLLYGQLKASKFVIATVGLGALFVIHAIFISPMPDVSILKAISWLIVTATLFSAWAGLSFEDREKLFRYLYLGLVSIMLASLPLYVLPLGYLRNGSGFQGILNHPQAFGPTMAILGAIAASKILSERKASWQYVGVFVLSFVLIMASEARTAGLAIVIGMCLAIAAVSAFGGRPIRSILPGLKSRRVWGMVAVALFFGAIFAPQISENVGHYISKSGRAGSVENISDTYNDSRGVLILRMFVNIKEHPFTGIGFGIASDPESMVVERDPVFGLPVSAAVEKGVLPLAIVEELGIPGALLVATWMLWILRRAVVGGVTGVAVVLTALLINMGENVFFSPGGLGMLVLIGITWAGSGNRGGNVKIGKVV